MSTRYDTVNFLHNKKKNMADGGDIWREIPDSKVHGAHLGTTGSIQVDPMLATCFTSLDYDYGSTFATVLLLVLYTLSIYDKYMQGEGAFHLHQ